MVLALYKETLGQIIELELRLVLNFDIVHFQTLYQNAPFSSGGPVPVQSNHPYLAYNFVGRTFPFTCIFDIDFSPL